MKLVEQFEKEGEFSNENTLHTLKLHLTAVGLYEKQESAQKVIKHMQGFNLLLDQQKDKKLISGKAYSTLTDAADSLIKKWQ